MNGHFQLNSIRLAILVAFPCVATSAFAAEPYPALPPTLSTSVTPNVLLHIDNSGSMNDRPAGYSTGSTKITIAKSVAKSLVTANPSLRWGIFTFDPAGNADTGGKLRAPVGSTQSTVTTTIDGLVAETWTPLGETLFEITRYFSGGSSYYGKINGTYTSPIQYRCQKNFAIILTDGLSTRDDLLPGVGGRGAVSYTSYNSSNTAETRTFKICTNTTDISTVLTCPSTLQFSSSPSTYASTTTPFLSGGSYIRSIRDVAFYAHDMDLRIGGNDSANVSFDDAKFRKQNLNVYTVAFDLNEAQAVNVLKATAFAGGGKYYAASNQASLTTALSNAVNDILANTSNAGGLATSSTVSSSGNKAYQPVFYPSGWTGDLLCYNFTSTGLVDQTSPCSTPKATIPAAGSRTIYSAKVAVSGSTPTTSTFPFNDSTGFSTMSSAQLSLLGSDATSQKKMINYLRGTAYSDLRTRTSLLGDMIDSMPLFLSAPASLNGSDTTFTAFQTANANRSIIFLGANDGMLHAFDSTSLSEIMAYVPAGVYPHLKALAATDYGQSAGTPHTYHVNGYLQQADIKSPTSGWSTILVGGLAQGGQSYFALNATSSSTLTSSASAAVRWEWSDASDSEMGYTFGKPIIYNIRTSTTTTSGGEVQYNTRPAVILTNGYENSYDDTAVGGQKTSSNSSALYIVDPFTGALIKKIQVPGGTGLSSPAGIASSDAGVLDYVYAGDINGKLWRFDLTSATGPSGFSVSTTPVFDAGTTHPIVMRPAITKITRTNNTVAGNLVLFGTGKLLTDADRTDTTTQTIYGVVDDISTAPVTVTRANLQAQTVVDTKTVTSGATTDTYRKVSQNTINLFSPTNTVKGWYIDLPTSSERLVAAPLLFTNKVIFGTGVTQSGDACLPGGLGWIMGLNPYTGSVTSNPKTSISYSFIDINGDGKSTTTDKVAFSSGSEYVSGYRMDQIPTELTFVAKSGLSTVATSATFSRDAGGDVAIREPNTQSVYYTISGNTSSAGTIIAGGKGSTDVSNKTGLDPTSGVKIETTIWREIK